MFPAGSVVEIIGSAQFDLAAKQFPVLIVKFTATWCGPCRRIAPAFERLASECRDEQGVRFLSVDVDKNQELARRFGVSAMPTFVAVSGGVPMPNVESVRGANEQAVGDLVKCALEALKQQQMAVTALFLAAASSSQQNPVVPKEDPNPDAKDENQISSSSQHWLTSYAHGLDEVKSTGGLMVCCVVDDDETCHETRDLLRVFASKRVRAALSSPSGRPEVVLVRVAQSEFQEPDLPVLDCPTVYIICYLNGAVHPLIMRGRGATSVPDVVSALETAHRKHVALLNPTAAKAELESLTVEERKARVKEKMDRIRREKEQEAAKEAVEKEKARIAGGKLALETKRKLKQLQEEQEARRLRKEKKDEKEAAKKIREQVRLDKLERQRKKQERAAIEVVESRDHGTSSANNNGAGACSICVTLLDGRRVKRIFPGTETTLGDVKSWVRDQASLLSSASFSLTVAYPRRVLSRANETQSLASLGLVPSSSLLMTATSDEEPRTKTAETTGIFSIFPFSLLASLFSFFTSFFSTPPAATVAAAAPTATPPPTSASSTPTAGRMGSMSALRQRGQKKTDDEREESYNGNSSTLL